MPVCVEVTVAPNGAELEYRLGPREAPTGTGEGHSIHDEVTAGPFNDASGDGPSEFERSGIVEVRSFVEQILGTGVGFFGPDLLGTATEGSRIAPEYARIATWRIGTVDALGAGNVAFTFQLSGLCSVGGDGLHDVGERLHGIVDSTGRSTDGSGRRRQ